MLMYNSVFYMYLNLEFTCPIKTSRNQLRKSLTSKHNSPKRNSQHYHVGLVAPTKDLSPKTPTVAHLFPPTTWYKMQG